MNGRRTIRARRSSSKGAAQALAIVQAIKDLRGEANTLGNLSIAHRKLGNLPTAIEYAEQQAKGARATGDQRAECNALGNLGRALFDSGRVWEANVQFAKMSDLSHEIGCQRGEAHAMWHSALAFDSLGSRKQATENATSALAIYKAVTDPRAEKVHAQLAE